MPVEWKEKKEICSEVCEGTNENFEGEFWRKSKKKFKSELAKWKNSVYIKKSSAMIEFNTDRCTMSWLKKTSKKFEKRLEKRFDQCYIIKPSRVIDAMNDGADKLEKSLKKI